MKWEESNKRNALVPAPRGTTWPPSWLKPAPADPPHGLANEDPASWPPEWQEQWRERVAVMVVDGLVRDHEAERLAARDVAEQMQRHLQSNAADLNGKVTQ